MVYSVCLKEKEKEPKRKRKEPKEKEKNQKKKKKKILRLGDLTKRTAQDKIGAAAGVDGGYNRGGGG
jgi:hypothetical protein